MREITLVLCWFSTAVVAGVPADEEWVVTEANAVANQAVMRPQVGEVVAGSFADLSTEAYRVLRQLSKTDTRPEAVRLSDAAVLQGGLPVSKISPETRSLAKAAAPSIEALLRATHTQPLRLSAGLQLFSLFAKSGDEGVLIQHAVRGTRLWIREAAEAKDSRRVQVLCIDAFALARDLSWGYLVTQMISSALMSGLVATCWSSAPMLSPAETSALLADLRKVDEGFAPLRDTFEKEALFGSLAGSGDTLDATTLAALPEPAVRLIEDARGDMTGRPGKLRSFLFGSYVRRKNEGSLLSAAAHADAAPREADHAFASIKASRALATFLTSTQVSGGDFLGILQRLRRGRAERHTLLAALAVQVFREEHGALPRSLAEAGVGDLKDDRTGEPLVIARENGLIYVGPAPSSAESKDSLRLVLP